MARSLEVPTQWVLIGPVCCGKSTVLPLVGRRLGLGIVDVDDVADAYLEEVGKGREALQAVGDDEGFLGAQRWWEPGLVHVVNRVIEDYPQSVIAMGAGHTHFLAEGLFEEVRQSLARAMTILILPSPDPSTSVRILRERSVGSRNMDWRYDGVDFVERWVTDPENHILADVTVFTTGLDPAETAEEIVRLGLSAAKAAP